MRAMRLFRADEQVPGDGNVVGGALCRLSLVALLVFVVVVLVVVELAGGVVGEGAARQVDLDGEDDGPGHHLVAVGVVLGHGRHKLLELEHDVLHCNAEGGVLGITVLTLPPKQNARSIRGVISGFHWDLQLSTAKVI